MAVQRGHAIRALLWGRIGFVALGAVCLVWHRAVEGHAAFVNSKRLRCRLSWAPTTTCFSARRLPPPPPPPPPRRRTADPPKEAKCIPKGQLDIPISIAVVIDGDGLGIEKVNEFMSDLQKHGQIVQASLYAEPRRVENANWAEALSSLNMEFVPVARLGSKPSRDPNDDAIICDVRMILQVPRIGAIAFLVADSDYVALVEDVVGAGKRCFVSMSKYHPGMARKFRKVGATILGLPRKPVADPKFMCRLRSSGIGIIEPLSQVLQNSDEDWRNTDWVASKLLALGYRDKPDDPLLSSVAKFWYDNSLGNLTVFPKHYAARSLANVFQDRSSATWGSSRNDLAFVFPVVHTTLTKAAAHTFGTDSCAMFVRGGGPFILRDSPELVHTVLLRMGFIDSGMNECLGEGMDVFASCSVNARALRKAGLDMCGADTTTEKISKIRKLLLSNSFAGTLQVPPRDVDVRRRLLKLRLLSSESASPDEVFDVMATHLRSKGISPKMTYNGRVLQLHNLFLSRLSSPSNRQ